MSDIQLFRLTGGNAVELPGRVASVEKQLQSLIEAQMPAFLGVRFLASEFAPTRAASTRWGWTRTAAR